nr:MAG TPA: type I neck protein [Caudoviricetes sp.]
MSFTYKIKGLDKYIRRVQGKPRQARQAVGEELRRSALRIERKAKIKVAVDTGFMRNGIFVVRVGMLRYKVISPAGYSVYVELGTRKMKAQPFLGPAVKEESEVLFRNLRKMFRR